MGDTQSAIRVGWWPPTKADLHAVTDETVAVATLEVERDGDEPGRLSIHTMVDGRGSLSSYDLGREEAIRLALDLLDAAILR